VTGPDDPAELTQPTVTQPPAPAAPEQAPRRRFDPLLAVVATVAVGVLIAALHRPRTGVFVVCGGLGAGAFLRLVLTTRNAGSLVVRRRHIDVLVLAGLAVALGIFAAITPFPSGHG
jgi:Protein of unknown function (DUF3017)